MTIWKNAHFDTFYYYGEADTSTPCEVTLGHGALTVSYQAEGASGYIVYKGRETARGHFELTAPAVDGRATLHRFPDAALLVGCWAQDGDRGMWRIDLGPAAP